MQTLTFNSKDNEYNSSFETLLYDDFSVTMDQKKLRCLATEMFEIINKLASPFICDLIQESTITESENDQIVEEKNGMSVPKSR